MKKLLLLLFCLCLFSGAFAQITAKESGIGIQGIARDANNNAKSNADISLRFSLYYLDENNGENQVSSLIENLRTDAFGVFSYVLNVEPEHYPTLSHHEVFLKIEEGTTVISDEKLKQVPYAINASNGVPTGSIMPYIGQTAPPGWVFCHGQDISNVPGSSRLRAILGSGFAPDLQGMFLRGAGTNNEFEKAGPELMKSQGDLVGSHSHEAGNLSTANGGEHSHRLPTDGTTGGNMQHRSVTYSVINAGSAAYFDFFTQPGGVHSHEIEGETGETGGEETRPINYGVHYIVKL